jgi:hypothetical protein
MKNLHKFFMKDLPWVNLIWTKYYPNRKVPGHTLKGSFWWKRMLKYLTTFKGIAHAQLGTGDTILFWQDMWNGRILAMTYHKLHSCAINKDVTVRTILDSEALQENFNLPLSEIVFNQFCELDIFLQSIQIGNDKDTWSYIWGNQQYSASKVYKHLIGFQQVHPAFKWLW